MTEQQKQKAPVAGFISAAFGGRNKLFELGGNKVFSVVHRFVSCLGEGRGLKPAPSLYHDFEHRQNKSNCPTSPAVSCPLAVCGLRHEARSAFAVAPPAWRNHLRAAPPAFAGAGSPRRLRLGRQILHHFLRMVISSMAPALNRSCAISRAISKILLMVLYLIRNTFPARAMVEPPVFEHPH